MNPGPNLAVPAPFQVAAVVTPDESRRVVAIVSQERTVIGALKFERNGFASAYFVAKIFNGSHETLACSILGRTQGKAVDLAPGRFWMNPQSVAQVPICVPLHFPHPLRSISLHMQAPSVRASAEADVPAPPLVRLARGIAATAALIGACAASWHAMRPQITAYALPARVGAGDVATASYSTSGYGSTRYEVTSGKSSIASGFLDDRSGSFSFVTPKRSAIYDVALSVTGPFGTARRELFVSAIPATTAQVAAIQALQPEPSVVHSGEQIQVRYIAAARRGTVTLYDASGIPLGHAPYNASGVSTLLAPTVETPTQYRVALDVSKGASSAQASAGLLVLPKPGSKPIANPTPIPGVLSAAQVFRVPSLVNSGARFKVRLLAHPPNLHVGIQDQQGAVIEDAVVPVKAMSVRFAAPRVDRDTPFVVVATFSRGNAAQTLLQPLVVHAP